MPEPQSGPPKTAAGTQHCEYDPEFFCESPELEIFTPESHQNCDSDSYLEWMEKFQYPLSPKEKKALNQMTDEKMKQLIIKRIRYEIGRDKEITNHREIWFKRIINFDQTNSDEHVCIVSDSPHSKNLNN
jgi:hypothetical protein